MGGCQWNEGVIKRCFNWYSQSLQSTQVSKSVLFYRVDLVVRQLTVIRRIKINISATLSTHGVRTLEKVVIALYFLVLINLTLESKNLIIVYR